MTHPRTEAVRAHKRVRIVGPDFTTPPHVELQAAFAIDNAIGQWADELPGYFQDEALEQIAREDRTMARRIGETW